MTDGIVSVDADDIFIDTDSYDFHLKQDASIIDAATTAPIIALGLTFTDDIDGQLRTTWDIGADEASIDFDPTVMQTGGDYSTLALWEAGVQTDLTADTTRVFSHGGITGTIVDGDTVTGTTSRATAIVVHATTAEILLETVSGTFVSGEQVQVDTSNHVTISNAGNPANAVAKIDGAWSAADTAAVEINGWTTGANNYVKVYTTDGARHNGTAGSAYVLEPTVPADGILILESYTQIIGIEITNWTTNFDGSYDGIHIGAENCLIDSCLVHDDGHGSENNSDAGGIQVDTASINAGIVKNCIVYNLARWGIAIHQANNSSLKVYNNTVYQYSF